MSLALIAVAVFSALGALLYWTLERELMRVEFDEVQSKIILVQSMLVEQGQSGIDDEFRRKLDDVLMGHGNLLVWIHARDGTRLFGNAQDPLALDVGEAPSTFTLPDGTVTSGCRVSIKEPGSSEGAQVTVAMAASMRNDVLRMYGTTVAWLCALGTLATAALAAWATRRGFRPVRRLAEHAGRIGPHSPSVRLPLDDEDDELQALTVSFNDALDRLQEAYSRLESFNADVAHELRTPLAALISGVEVTLAAPRSQTEIEQLLAANLELLQRMRVIVNDMLFLARADVGEQATGCEWVSLAGEAAKVIEYYDGLIADSRAKVVCEGDASVRCNAGLVRRALSNLLSNALKYSSGPHPHVVAIRVMHTHRGARVSVRNVGDTIPRQDLARIFDRFYRAEPSRAPRADSNGLGLAIVRAIALMHRGTVDASSNGGITVVSFELAK